MKKDQQEDDPEESPQKSKDSKVRDYSILIFKSGTNKRSARIHWRYNRRSRNCDDHPKWSSKRLRIFYPRNMLKKETNQIRKAMGIMCPRRRNNLS